jgi:lysophospholipase L1-like esterase
MTFFRTLRRTGLRVLAPLAAAAMLLTACGGGTSQVQTFVPARLLVVGDETGMLVDDGSHDGFKYGLNDRTGTTAGKCLLLPTPAQQVAAYYGMRFKECNPLDDKGVRPVANAVALAQAGALIDETASGLKAQVTGITDLGSTDMVVVTIGTNDIIKVFEDRRAGNWTTDVQAIAEARRRGTAAAVEVTRILASGARALVFTLPVLGKSPYAIAAETASAGAAALITALTDAFNAGLRVNIDPQDGRQFGLVLLDDVTAAMERFPTSFLGAPANTTAALCAGATLPQGCLVVVDTDGVAPDNSVAANTHLWATDRFVGPVALNQIGAQAVSRAANNPF